MSKAVPSADRLRSIDESVAQWRQGDVSLGSKWLALVVDLASPLTAESREAGSDSDDVAVLPVEVDGVVVVTQTCDIVRPCSDRPFVQVAPVQRVSEDEAQRVARGHHPRFVRIPAFPTLVGDLDRITTIEKSVLAGWERTPGWTSDAEVRGFARGVARKTSRFAFPDDLTVALDGLRKRIVAKHERESPEGLALRDHLAEVRVTASPSWDAESISVFLTFLRQDTSEAASIDWSHWLDGWLGLCCPTGRIVSVEGAVMTRSAMTAQEYVDSDQLDLDHLSRRTPDKARERGPGGAETR